MIDSLLLSALVLLPVAGAILLCFVHPTAEKKAKFVALGVSLLTLALAGVGLALYDTTQSGMQFAKAWTWIQLSEALEIRYAVGVDGMSLALAALTALLTPLCVLCSWKAVHDRAKGFMIALLVLEASVMGVFVARDLFLFYVFWEAMLIPMALLIGVWGGPRRVYAAVKFFLFTMAGSVLMLIAIIFLAVKCGTFSMDELPGRIVQLGLAPGTEHWLFLAFALAFAVKVPLFPLHTWLPDAHVEAPTAGSVMLAGVLLKMGAYGFLRIALPFFPQSAAHYAGLFITLSVISIIFGALMSMAQSDIKKLIAYSSVSHMGFVMLGIFSFNAVGAQGAILQMVNHGLSTGALFLLVGVIYERTHKRGVDDFGGLTKVMPRYATVFMVVTLSSIGLPGLNGFVGEFLVLMGAYLSNRWAAGLAATGVVLGAVYMLKLYRDVFFGKITSSTHEKLTDLDRTEVGMLAPLLILIVLLGVAPGLVLKMTAPAADAAIQSIPVEADHGKR